MADTEQGRGRRAADRARGRVSGRGRRGGRLTERGPRSRAPKAATLAIDGAGADILPEQPPRKTAAATVEVAVCRLAHAEGLPLPAYQSEGAAGLDLSAALGPDGKLKIKPGRSTLVPTGLALAIPPGFEGQVRPRSGLALRHGLTVLNAPGTIDSDFRGEVKVLLVNLGVDRVHIAHGDRIAQLVIAPVSRAVLVETAELPVSPRGDGGFGSTGTAAAKRSSRKRH